MDARPPALKPTPPPATVADPLAVDPTEESAQTPPPRRTAGPGGAQGLNPDGSLKSGKLAGLSMGTAILMLSWPILAESYLNALVGLTDTYLAAHLPAGVGVHATDAISAASYVLWLVGLIAMAIGVGATALVSRAVGAGRLAVANAATGQAVLLAVISGVGLSLGAIAAAGPLTRVYGLTGDTAADFQVFLRTTVLSTPAMTVLASGIAAARGAGDSVRPLLSMVVVNAANMMTSWVLSGVRLPVVGNPFGLDLGIAGIAWGTVIGEYVGAAVVLWVLARGAAGVRLQRRRLRPHWHTLRRLIRVGVPNFLETFGMWAANFLVVLMVRWLAQEGTLGTHILAIRIESFSYMPSFAMGAAAATLVGQYLGAGTPASARRAVRRCAAMASLICGAVGLVFILAPRALVSLISQQPEHLAIGPTLLIYAGFVQIPFGVGNVLRSALRGAGDVRWVMVLTWVSTYGVRLPLAYALSGVDLPIPAWLNHGEPGVLHNPFSSTPSLGGLWAGLCVELVIRCALFGARFLQGGWARARV